MAIICDNCGKDVTPDDKYAIDSSDIKEYTIIDIMGKMCLCNDCLSALYEFVTSKAFKDFAKDFNKKREAELKING